MDIINIKQIMILLILLFVCHWMADYTHLSMPFMLKAKRTGSPLWPIWLHACVHASLMLVVCCLFGKQNIHFAIGLQLVSHFIIDVLKGKMNVWFPSLSSPANPYHWYVFGFDQLLHTFVIIAMWYALQ